MAAQKKKVNKALNIKQNLEGKYSIFSESTYFQLILHMFTVVPIVPKSRGFEADLGSDVYASALV